MRALIAIPAALVYVAAANAGAPPGCRPLPGAEALLSRPGLRFVLVGEIHGTNETPAIFRDLVCAAAAGKRPVVVGVERSRGEQTAIDAFMAPDQHEAAVCALLAEGGWSMFDGRSSRAMLALLESLRALKLKGHIAEVVAFSDPADAPLAERHMASILTAAAKRHPNALVIALTGNLHASKKLQAGFGSYPFMAMFLPLAQTVSLFVTDKGGEAWTQQNGECGPHKQGDSRGAARGVVLSASAAPLPGFDGVLSTGAASTASFPAIQDAPPPPACSKQ